VQAEGALKKDSLDDENEGTILVPMAEPKRISPSEAHDLLADGFTYVDVRTEEEFDQGHPAGAHNVPFMLSGPSGMAPNPEFVGVMEAAFPKDAKLVLGCRSGGRSLKAARALMTAGYTNVLDQRAGWDGARDAFGGVAEPGWSRTALPSETGKPAGRSYADARAKRG
jgi:rhodanese-related sulfurtransferase